MRGTPPRGKSFALDTGCFQPSSAGFQEEPEIRRTIFSTNFYQEIKFAMIEDDQVFPTSRSDLMSRSSLCAKSTLQALHFHHHQSIPEFISVPTHLRMVDYPVSRTNCSTKPLLPI